MTSIAALQLGRYDINVNAICPGSTLTTMAAATMSGRAARTGQTMDELAGRPEHYWPSVQCRWRSSDALVSLDGRLG